MSCQQAFGRQSIVVGVGHGCSELADLELEAFGVHLQGALIGEPMQGVFGRRDVCHVQVLSCLHSADQVQYDIDFPLAPGAHVELK